MPQTGPFVNNLLEERRYRAIPQLATNHIIEQRQRLNRFGAPLVRRQQARFGSCKVGRIIGVNGEQRLAFFHLIAEAT